MATDSEKIAEAYVDIKLSMANFERELKRAEGTTKESVSRMESAFSSIGGGISKTVSALKPYALAVGAAGTALAYATKKALDFASEIVDSARGLGLSTDALQELRFAAAQSGVNISALNTALGALAKNQAEATDENSEAADMFARLGVNIKDTEGNLKPLDELFTEVGARIGELNTVSERNLASMALMGRGGRELGKLFTEGAEGIAEARKQAHELGLVINEDVLKETEAAGDKFDALFQIIKVTGVAAIAQFAGDLTNLADTLFYVTQKAREFFDVFREEAELATVEGAAEQIRELEQTLAAMKQGKDDELTGIFAPDPVKLKYYNQIITDTEARLVAARDRLNELIAAGEIGPQQAPSVTRTTGAPNLLPSPKDTAEAEKIAKDATDKAIAEEARLVAAEKALINDLVRARLQAEQDEISLVSERRARRIEDIELTIRDERAKQEALANIDAEFNADMIEIQRTAEEERAKKTKETLEEQRKSLDEFNDAFANTMADLVGITDENAKEMFRIFFKEFVLRAIESMASIESLGSGVDWVTGGIGTVLKAVGFAKGGITTKPTMGVLSEHGQRESVIPFDITKTGLGGGDVEIIINNNTPSQVTAKSGTSQRGTRQLLIEIDTIVADSISSGGKTSRAIEKTWGLSRRGERVG